ncbi:hypothetical protein EI555_019153, partial [Monodon monoceros]
MGCTRDAILDALENLTTDEFKKFKMKLLSVPLREGYGRIPRGTLLPMDAVDLTDKLVSYYMEAYSAELTVLVLCNIGMQEVAEQLKETLREGECAPSTQVQTSIPSTPSSQPKSPGTTPAGIKAPPQTAAKPALHFVEQHRAALIARVTDVDGVLDALYGKVLTEDQYQAVRAERTNPTKMRKLFSFAPAWNLTCKDLLLQALRDTQPYLRSHRQPLAVPAILPGVSDFFNIHMKIQLVLAHAELSYISKCRSGSDDALASAGSWGSRLPKHFILPASVTKEWSLTHH